MLSIINQALRPGLLGRAEEDGFSTSFTQALLRPGPLGRAEEPSVDGLGPEEEPSVYNEQVKSSGRGSVHSLALLHVCRTRPPLSPLPFLCSSQIQGKAGEEREDTGKGEIRAPGLGGLRRIQGKASSSESWRSAIYSVVCEIRSRELHNHTLMLQCAT